MTTRRRILLALFAVSALGGCAPFQTTIINDSLSTLEAVECVYPDGNRIMYRDVEPMRFKAFSSPRPKGPIRLFWLEPAGTFGVTLPGERLKDTIHSGDGILVLRIEDEPTRHVRVYATPARSFSQSLLQERGDSYPATPIQP